jgi:phosphatidylserine/phosphatidylglycerophosphate/cardiolipin synthase-like enzyme
MYALAISNNDMVYLYWYVEKKIPDCLGFSVVRHDAETNKSEALPADVGFPDDPGDGKTKKTTNEWPIQKFTWKDVYAERDKSYWYEIVPMIGKPTKLKPDLASALRTRTVTLSPDHGSCSVFFNRGIISTQAIARSLPKGHGGAPVANALRDAIAKIESPLRKRLVGNLDQGVLKLLERAQREGGSCYCALYELTDRELIEALEGLKNVHVVLSNADSSEQADGKTKKVVDGTNENSRKELHEKGVDVVDRFVASSSIGHNKFVVYVDSRNKPKAVLSGSTNWTPSGLCAQSNNAIVVESSALAEQYLAYWTALKDDTTEADGVPKDTQSKTFRSANNARQPDVDLPNGEGSIRAWFSPNTKQKTRPKDNLTAPSDLEEVFSVIEGAKQGILFLAFIPGKPSIVTKIKEVYDEKSKAKHPLFVRGAATDTAPADLFKVQLFDRTMKADAEVRPISEAKVVSVAGISDPFGVWEREIYKLGHAVIHDKIVVIDPFTDDSIVVTGSHNLGYKASYSNDENMLIIRGNRPVAEAYAAHVLDVYEHYRWRWRLLNQAKKKDEVETSTAWHMLKPNDKWQDWYVDHKEFLAAETLFWSPVSGPSPSAASSSPRRRRGGTHA